MFNQFNYQDPVHWKNTPVFQNLQMIFGPKVKVQELVSFVNSITEVNPNLRLTREEKRLGYKLIQWFELHWDEIQPYFPDYNHNDDDDDNNNNFFSFDNDDENYNELNDYNSHDDDDIIFYL